MCVALFPTPFHRSARFLSPASPNGPLGPKDRRALERTSRSRAPIIHVHSFPSRGTTDMKNGRIAERFPLRRFALGLGVSLATVTLATAFIACGSDAPGGGNENPGVD